MIEFNQLYAKPSGHHFYPEIPGNTAWDLTLEPTCSCLQNTISWGSRVDKGDMAAQKWESSLPPDMDAAEKHSETSSEENFKQPSRVCSPSWPHGGARTPLTDRCWRGVEPGSYGKGAPVYGIESSAGLRKICPWFPSIVPRPLWKLSHWGAGLALIIL